MKDSATRHKILLAAIESIERYGISGCTVRNIAEEAGVAYSSLLYYFESKEQLLDSALRHAFSHSMADLDELWQTRVDDTAGISAMLTYVFDGAVKYPGVSRAGLQDLLMNGNTDGLVPTGLNTLLKGVIDELAEKRGLPREKLALKIIGVFSTVFYLGISPQAYAACTDEDFAVRERRTLMVSVLTEDLLNP